MVEPESLDTLMLSWLAEARWLNVVRAALDSRRLWWDKTDPDIFGSITPWRVPGGVPFAKSMSRLAAMAATASVFRREDESNTSPRARRVSVRVDLVVVSSILGFILSGMD